MKSVSRLSRIQWDRHLFSINCEVVYLNEAPLLQIMEGLKKEDAIEYVCFNEAMPLKANTLTGEASEESRNLREFASNTRGDSYCPYSKNKVVAALLTNDGETITRCSVENRRPSLKTCALQMAFIKAVSSSKSKFKAAAICAEMGEDFLQPCGSCRQFCLNFAMIYLCL
jgi:cytidine deaminase